MAVTFYRCRVVKCLTKGCDQTLVLQVIDKADHVSQVRFPTDCHPFVVSCRNCDEEHTYTRDDVREILLTKQRIGFLHPAFAKALQPEMSFS